MAPPRNKCSYIKMVNKVVPATETESKDASAQPQPSSSSPPATSEPPRTQLVAQKCKEQAQRIVGDCNFCGKGFCSKHRMLEAHECPGLEDCKGQERERNRTKLESERTVMLRGM